MGGAKKGSLQTPTLVIKGIVKEGKKKREEHLGRGGNMAVHRKLKSQTEPGVSKGRCMCPKGSRISTGVQGKSQNLHLQCNPKHKGDIKLNKHKDSLVPHSVLTVTYHKPWNPKRRSKIQRWMVAPYL